MDAEATSAAWCSDFPQPLLADESILSHYNELRTLFTESRDKLATAEAQIDTPNVLIWAPMAVCSITRCGGKWRQSGAYRLCVLLRVQTVCVFCWQFRRSVCFADSSVTVQKVCVFCWQFSHCSGGLCVPLGVQSLCVLLTVQSLCVLLTVQSLLFCYSSVTVQSAWTQSCY